jgi:hypothetical protein
VTKSAKRKAWFLAAAVPVILLPVMALGTGAASAGATTDPGPTCSLVTTGPNAPTIEGDNGGAVTNATASLVAQDSIVGLKHQIQPYHINSESNIQRGNLGATTAPVTTTFTQSLTGYTASGSLTVTNEADQKTTCLAQFKSVTNGGRVESTGLAFPYDRNNLVILNSSSMPLSYAEVTVNGAGGCNFYVNGSGIVDDLSNPSTIGATPMTPGQLTSVDMSNIGGINCLAGDGGVTTPETFNTVTVTGWLNGNTTVGAGLADVIVWGDGSFVGPTGSPLPE